MKRSVLCAAMPLAVFALVATHDASRAAVRCDVAVQAVAGAVSAAPRTAVSVCGAVCKYRAEYSHRAMRPCRAASAVDISPSILPHGGRGVTGRADRFYRNASDPFLVSLSGLQLIALIVAVIVPAAIVSAILASVLLGGICGFCGRYRAMRTVRVSGRDGEEGAVRRVCRHCGHAEEAVGDGRE